MLLRAAQQLAARLASWRGAGERAHVGEDVAAAGARRRESSASRRRAGRRQRAATSSRRRRRSRARASAAARALRGAAAVASAASTARERDALAAPALGGVAVERLELQQRRLRADVDVGADEHLAHAAARTARSATSPSSSLSTTATTSPAATSSPAATGIATTTAGRVAADEAAVVARDAVRDAVDLDEQVGVLQRRSACGACAPPSVRRRSCALSALDVGLDARRRRRRRGSGRARSGRRRSGRPGRGGGGRPCAQTSASACGRPRRASA